MLFLAPSRRSSLVSALSLAVALGCGAAPASHDRTAPRSPSSTVTLDASDAAGLASASNALGVDLWQALRAEHGAENLALSPASITTALAMTYGGARGGTASAMASVMHVSSSPDATMDVAGALCRSWNDPARTDYELAVANRLFGDALYGFRADYVGRTRDAFDAELERLDFRSAAEPSRAHINEWIGERTHDRIPELLPRGSITGDTRLVLVNAVYFHGRWAVPFDPDATRERAFYAPGGAHPVPTMHACGGRYGEADGVVLLERRYEGDDVAMLFVLPTDRDGLSAIEDGLSAAQIADWASRTSERPDLIVALPRFRIETDTLDLTRPLMDLGMAVAFSDDADFSAMSDPNEIPLKIDAVYHRVFVELDEEGTEAAAATAVTMVEISSAGPRPEPPRFVADHPFLFFLRDLRTGAVLFSGRVVDPA